MRGKKPGSNADQRGDYGQTPGQLGNLPAGDVGAVDGIVSSPPYEGSMVGAPSEKTVRRRNESLKAAAEAGKVGPRFKRMVEAGKVSGNTTVITYGETEGQLGESIGETFWSAALQIVRECYAILRPGGVAYWVVKNFVRAKKIVPFSDQWRQLCESVGFVTIEWIKASLVEEIVEADGTVRRKERKSFFRRLAEKKGSPQIDHEDVLVMRKMA
jgi:hypothetical protein